MENTPKRKKKNKAQPLLILVGILAVLTVAYAAVSSANDKREAAEAAAANVDTTIMLAQQDYTAITELKWKTDGEWISLTQSAGKWSLTEDGKFPLDQAKAAQLGNAIASIGAMRAVEEGTAAQYGLDEPACEIHVCYGPGTTYKYAIGNHNSFNDAYYFRDDDGAFYMIASGLLTYFQVDLHDLILLDTGLDYMTDADLVSFTVTDGDRNQTFTQTAAEVTAEDGTTTTIYDADMTDLYGLFCELDLLSWEDYYADADEMAASYGIDGSKTMTLTYKKSVTVGGDTATDGQNQTPTSTTKVDAAYEIRFGTSSDGTAWYSPKGSTIVYTASSDIVEQILTYAGN